MTDFDYISHAVQSRRFARELIVSDERDTNPATKIWWDLNIKSPIEFLERLTKARSEYWAQSVDQARA